jgi:hypothetical protein
MVSLSRFRSKDLHIFVTISTSHLVEIEVGVRLCHVCDARYAGLSRS